MTLERMLPFAQVMVPETHSVPSVADTIDAILLPALSPGVYPCFPERVPASTSLNFTCPPHTATKALLLVTDAGALPASPLRAGALMRAAELGISLQLIDRQVWDGQARKVLNAGIMWAASRPPDLPGETPVLWIGGPSNAIPSIAIDESEVARIAVEHFSLLGLQHLALLPGSRATEREEGFFHHAHAAGCSCSRFSGATRPACVGIGRSTDELLHWIGQLPRPLGLLVDEPVDAINVCQLLRQHQISVPDEVAVLTCDRDVALVSASRPRVSAIDRGINACAQLAVDLMHDHLRGGPLPIRTLAAPVGVHAAASTNVVHVRDRAVRAAIQLVRTQACDIASLDDLLPHLPVSRRTLEKAYQQHLGCSIWADIVRIRMQHAISLLSDTEASIDRIALQCGYQNRASFTKAFQRTYQRSPGDWRRTHRMPSGVFEV